MTSVKVDWEDPENHRFYGIFSESRCVASSRNWVNIWCMYVDWVPMYIYHRAVTVEFRYCLIEWVSAEIFAKISRRIKLRIQMVVISVLQNDVWMIWRLVYWFHWWSWCVEEDGIVRSCGVPLKRWFRIYNLIRP